MRYCAALLLLSGAALAQDATLAPSDALRCLMPIEPERSALSYPRDALERKEGGIVRAELRFDHPDRAPEIKLADDPLREFANAVHDHLSRYRVPCLRKGQQVTLTQEFRFDPTDGRKVMWTRPRDLRDAGRHAALRCVTRSPKPNYPSQALQADSQGNVVVRATFADAHSAPHLEVLDNTPHRSLIDAARWAAEQMRMPCHEGAPESVDVHYAFRIDGGDRWVMPDMALVKYVASVKDIRKAQVYFDFNEMKCPFDLRIWLWQPVADNVVGEIGETVPERAFFIDWLSRQRLALPAKQQNQVIGQSLDVSVPCGRLSLGTTTGGSASQ